MSDIVHETIKGKIQSQFLPLSQALSRGRTAAQSRDAVFASFVTIPQSRRKPFRRPRDRPLLALLSIPHRLCAS
ncbi:uncharacterized protein SPSK_06812 [Sporothrix schenckii 1099-18]|uniref:Uncharacterized protein n=1 Tax=Sporothrix schenckii 1099-18 TaxID=1397361 RepID=A0A0F2MHK5_SPOSC|nr:uncharacterized protein SPSK_06812 [Sporothrix schenckii 1099-18]KJR89178.1 hypothetical protein SPSK_06812 [Sporothrix schenckii 1099-18]